MKLLARVLAREMSQTIKDLYFGDQGISKDTIKQFMKLSGDHIFLCEQTSCKLDPRSKSYLLKANQAKYTPDHLFLYH